MSVLQHHLSDEEKSRITTRVEELARFERGDHVTVEPMDTDIAYAGRELEGVHLVVDRASWHGNDLSRNPEDMRQRSPEYFQPERVIELDDGSEVYLHNIEYYFVEPGYSMSEDALMPWSEYRESHDRVQVWTDEQYTSVYLEPAEEPCAVCDCNLVRSSFYDNGIIQAGSEKCPACGDVKAEHTP